MSQNVPFPFAAAPPSVATPQQNTRQTQTPTMAAPSAGGDMASLLAAMNITPDQLAKIAYLMQSGQLTLPPPPPPTLPDATPPAPPSNQAPSIPAVDPRLQRPAPAEDVEVDKEDGEVEEGEVHDAPEPMPREFLRTPPKGPRKHSRSPVPRFPNAQDTRQNSQQHQRPPSPRLANGVRQSSGLHSTNNAAGGQTNGDSRDARKVARNAAAKDIILKLHNNGYSFDDVAKAISNRKVLRRVYNQLGLPAVSPKPAPATVSTTTAAAVQSPVSEPQRKVSQPKKAVPAKPANLDRSAYLAKLQAAKKKKAEPAATSASPIHKPGTTPAVPKQAPAATVGAIPALAEKVASKNDLIRQRMAALAAERAAKDEAKRKAAEAANDGEIVMISSDQPQPDGVNDNSKPGLGDGLARAGALAQDIATGQDIHSPRNIASPRPSFQLPTLPKQPVPKQTTSPTLSRGFGLPGLFTTSSPLSPASFHQQQTAAFAPPPRAATQSRPHSANAFNLSTAQKRPYGQVNNDDDNRVVIVDSDEDDSEEDMDIDNDDAPVESSALTGGAQALGLLKDFPPKPALSKLTTSVPGTPGTPGNPTPAQLKMDQEIAEMKRKIAEAESRKRRKTSSTDQAQQTMAPSAETAAVQTVQSTLTLSAEPAKLSLREQREQLEQRLRDLQSQGIGTGLISPPAPVTAALVNIQSADSAEARPAPAELPSTDAPDHASNTVHGVTKADAEVDGEDGEVEDDYEPDFDLAPTSTNGQPATAWQLPNNGEPAVAPTIGIDEPSTQSVEVVQSRLENHNVLPRPNNMEENDEDIDDEDLGDIYADTADSNIENEAQDTALTTNTEPDDEEDETDDAMATSGDPTDSDPEDQEIEEDYEPELDDATTTAIQARQTTSSELNHGADLQVRVEAEQSSRAASEDDSSSSASSPPVDEGAVDLALGQTKDSAIEPEAGTIADIVAPELRPVIKESAMPRAESPPRTTSFKPYESPLVRFKDFRYHPEFTKTIAGGHRSLTYSNRIDPEKVLCPFEAAGQECQDSSCIHQHFKNMTLSDNDLLRLIGAERTPARTPEESKRWKTGLTAVVQKLRETNVGKDVECIASRIAEYRREFLSDPTQTILLK